MYSCDKKPNFQQLLLSVFFNASLLNKIYMYMYMLYIIYCLYLCLSVISLFLPHRQCDGTTVGFIAPGFIGFYFKNCSVRKLQSYLILCNDGENSALSNSKLFFINAQR